MSQTAFVTGGAGYLGRRLVKDLIQKGLKVRCLVRQSTDLVPLTSSLNTEEAKHLTFVYGDVSNRAMLDAELSNVDLVYHLAASLNGSTSTMFLNTVIPTRSILEAATVAGVKRFVLVSSLGVYGTGTVKRGGPLNEDTPVDPHPEQRDPYTFSKVRQEEIAWQAYQNYGLPLVVVRPGVIYGPGRSLLTSRVGLSLGPLLIRMGGGHRLPFTYVENCAQAISLAGLTPDIEGEVFNIVDDELPTGKKIIRFLRKHGKRIRTIGIPSFAINSLSSIYEWYSRWSEGQLPNVITRYKSDAIWKPVQYSNQKAKSTLGWTPMISTEDALSRTVKAT